MRQNPKGWSYPDVVPLLKRLNFTFESADASGSHRWWHHEKGAIVGFPDHGHGPMKSVYVTEFIAAIDDLGLLNEPRTEEAERDE